MRKNSPVGGQAVMEGVMMRSEITNTVAIAVRKQDGEIAVDVKRSPIVEKPWYKKAPFVRGVVNFIQMLIMGMNTLNRSVELGGYEDEEEPSKFEKWLAEKTGKSLMDVTAVVGVILGVALAIGLFVFLPQLIISLLGKLIRMNSFLMSLLEGVLRLAIFLGYLAAVSALDEIKRFFGYHGAEHKTINCYEAGEQLTVENVMKHTTRHPRCGTSFLLIVMVISILVFALTGLFIETGSNMLLRLGLRLAMLPLVAALSYEALMLMAKHENKLTYILRAPGMALQRMTTRIPDEGMCEVAITAFAACLSEEDREFYLPKKETEEEPEAAEEAVENNEIEETDETEQPVVTEP